MAEQTHIKAVIFDLGGVLLRTDNPQPREELAERMGVTRLQLEEIVFNNPVAQRTERGLATPEENWAEVARLLQRPSQEIAAIRAAFFGGDTVDFELIQFIQNLRPAYTTALLSNAWYPDLPGFLRNDLHIPDIFDVVVSSAQCGMKKPDADIFHATLALVQARPEEAVFVDDFAKNIQAAAGLGIHTVHFRSAAQAREELAALLGISQ
jgi:epoxide hydrolase-like predicted phosphatase